MINIIGWLNGLLSLANIKAELVSLQNENAMLKKEYETTQQALSNLVDKLNDLENSIEDKVNDITQDSLSNFQNDFEYDIDDKVERFVDDKLDDALPSDEQIEHRIKNIIERGKLNLHLKEAVQFEVESDWFEIQVSDMIKSVCKELIPAEANEEAKENESVIDQMVLDKINSLVIERMEAKFGEGWDSWFEEHTRYCIKNVLGEFLAQAYEQTKQK
jgi:hypothetical protein